MNRIYSQYRNKPKTIEWLNITPTLAESLHATAENTRRSYNIDDANRYELTVIGNIVGVTRGFEAVIPWLNSSEYDEVYRMLIRAKIQKNRSHCTYDDVLTTVAQVFQTKAVRILDRKNFTFGIIFDEPLTTLQKLVLASYPVVPAPQGVNFFGYNETTSTNTFGDGKTFGAGQTFSSYFGF